MVDWGILGAAIYRVNEQTQAERKWLRRSGLLEVTVRVNELIFGEQT
jgi:hypothetical protein